MFFSREPENPALDETIDDVFASLRGFEAETEEFAKAMDQLEKLYEIKDRNKSKPMSKDTLIQAVTHILGIVVIVGYEQKHVLTSKALGFPLKFR